MQRFPSDAQAVLASAEAKLPDTALKESCVHHAVVIRQLGPDDVEAYRSLRLARLVTDPDAFGSVHVLEAAMPLERHAQRLADSRVFGAYDATRLVGMVGLRQDEGPKDAHKGTLWGLYVEPGHRRGGVGGALLSTVLQSARGLVDQVLLSVVAQNPQAEQLYVRFGFVRYGVEPRALKQGARVWDEVLMVRFLDPPASGSQGGGE